MDAYCNLNSTCPPGVPPFFARFDTDAQGGPPTWRCYGASSLDPTHSKYVSGSNYCTRPAQLLEVQGNCARGINTTYDVFVNGEGGYPCIRIPSIVRVPGTGELVAFAECREWVGDGCGPLNGSTHSRRVDVCTKRSADNGRTWTPLVVVQTCGIQPTATVIPPSTVVLQMDVCTTGNGSLLQRTSSDGGVTWSAPLYFGASLGPGIDGSFVGPGVGIRLSDSHPVAPGRVLFIAHHGAYGVDYVWYSDDDGATYTLSQTPLPKMDEAQLVEAADGTVVANMRNDHLNASCDCRAVARSTDGGVTFGPIGFDPALISPVCMATIVRDPTSPAIYFANPASLTERTNGTIRRSLDGALSWTSAVPITSLSYAYSCLVAGPEQPQMQTVGLLWETGAGNCVGDSCSIAFSSVPVSLFQDQA